MDASSQCTGGESGFSRADLLIVLVMLALLALMLVPSLARTKTDSRGFQCLNNHRQLARAMRMYADDNNDRFPNHYLGVAPNYPLWAVGWLDWNASSDNTNTIYLTDPRYSALAIYCGKSARLFKCPTDRYLSGVQISRSWRERVRSISANPFVGESNVESISLDPAYNHLRKWSELLNPNPSETWISLDEHPDSINDGSCFPPGINQWVDLPASYHDGGAAVAYADGRAEVHRWQSSVLKVPVNFAAYLGTSIPINDADKLWLRYRTPRKPGMN